jgi:hypothetical protein
MSGTFFFRLPASFYTIEYLALILGSEGQLQSFYRRGKLMAIPEIKEWDEILFV